MGGLTGKQVPRWKVARVPSLYLGFTMEAKWKKVQKEGIQSTRQAGAFRSPEDHHLPGPRCVKRALETAGGFAHAPSMGRAEALKAIGRNLARGPKGLDKLPTEQHPSGCFSELGIPPGRWSLKYQPKGVCHFEKLQVAPLYLASAK